MATIKNKKKSDFPKLTGPVRISSWKNRVVIASKGETACLSSSSRRFNTQRFSLLRQLFSPTRLFVRYGFAHSGVRPADRALKVNYSSAFTGTPNNVRLSFPDILFSEGQLPLPESLKAYTLSRNIISLTWSECLNNASMMILLYNPERNQAIVNINVASANRLSAQIAYDPLWKGSSCHIYVAFRNDDDNTPSAYLGHLKLNHSVISEFDSSTLFFARKNRPYKRKQPSDFSVSGISGKVGNLNFFTSKNGDTIVRTNPLRSRPRTLPELQACERFKIVSHFLYTMHPFVKLGFDFANATSLPHNAAMRVNMPRIIGGSWPDYSIILDKVILSDGPLLPPADISVSLTDSTGTHNLQISLSTPPDSNHILLGLYNPLLDTSIIQSFPIPNRDSSSQPDYSPIPSASPQSDSLTVSHSAFLLPLPSSWFTSQPRPLLCHLYLAAINTTSSTSSQSTSSSPVLCSTSTHIPVLL